MDATSIATTSSQCHQNTFFFYNAQVGQMIKGYNGKRGIVDDRSPVTETLYASTKRRGCAWHTILLRGWHISCTHRRIHGWLCCMLLHLHVLGPPNTAVTIALLHESCTICVESAILLYLPYCMIYLSCCIPGMIQ